MGASKHRTIGKSSKKSLPNCTSTQNSAQPNSTQPHSSHSVGLEITSPPPPPPPSPQLLPPHYSLTEYYLKISLNPPSFLIWYLVATSSVIFFFSVDVCFDFFLQLVVLPAPKTTHETLEQRLPNPSFLESCILARQYRHAGSYSSSTRPGLGTLGGTTQSTTHRIFLCHGYLGHRSVL